MTARPPLDARAVALAYKYARATRELTAALDQPDVSMDEWLALWGTVDRTSHDFAAYAGADPPEGPMRWAWHAGHRLTGNYFETADGARCACPGCVEPLD
jgi:hypothetical protein